MPKASRIFRQSEIAGITKDTSVGGIPGLLLQVRGASKYYVLRRRHQGKRVEIGIGAASAISLDTARLKASEIARQMALGGDVLRERKRIREAAQAVRVERSARSKIPTFEKAAAEYIGAQESGWKNAKHAQQWATTLSKWAFPIIGDVPVSDIALSHILQIFQTPVNGEIFWNEHRETARRVQQRIAKILSWAESKEYRQGRNHATWDVLQHHLPAAETKDRKHYKAMPYTEVPAFVRRLRSLSELSTRLLEFIILTAVRSGEARGARWSEVDFENKTWTIPGGREGRMKKGKTHIVPLSPAAVRLLNDLPRFETAHDAHDLIFPNIHVGKQFSDNVFKKTFVRLGVEDATTHGFRASFCSWGKDAGFREMDLNACLAHVVRNKVEVAYLRDDLRRDPLRENREILDAWADFVEDG